MTANAATTTFSTPRRRVGLATSWRIERTKVRTSWFLIGAVILGIFAQLLGAWNYTTNLSIFQEQGVTWTAIWVQGGILVTSIFLPLLYVVILAHTGSLEYQTRGWQRLASIDRVAPAMLGKVLVALELALIGMAVYCAAAIACGLLLGFDPSQLGPYLVRGLCGALGAWVIGTVTMLLATWFRTFATISAAGLVLVIAGMGLTMAVPPLATAYPFTLITFGMGAREQTDAEFASPANMLGTATICLAWIALSTALTISRIRRREW
jgi:hypothetical protein